MSAGDRDTLAFVELLAEHTHVSVWWTTDGAVCRCDCGEKFREGGDAWQIHDDDYDAHRAHLADVLLASDWLREQRAEAWKAGHGWCDDGDLGCDHEPFTPNPCLED